jgi:hypothetical protein
MKSLKSSNLSKAYAPPPTTAALPGFFATVFAVFFAMLPAILLPCIAPFLIASLAPFFG